MKLFTSIASPFALSALLDKMSKEMGEGKTLPEVLGSEDAKVRTARAAARKVATLMGKLGAPIEKTISKVEVVETQTAGKVTVYVIGNMPAVKWALPMDVPPAYVAPVVRPQVAYKPIVVTPVTPVAPKAKAEAKAVEVCGFCGKASTGKVEKVPVCDECRAALK